MSTAALQRHMQNEVRDQAAMGREAHMMVRKLAEIGEGQHAHAGLQALLEGIGVGAAQRTDLEASVYTTTMLLPSTVVKLLFREYPRDFKRLLGADTNKLRDFWTTFLARPRTREWAAAHPQLAGKSVGDLVSTIPCTVHADAGPCSKTQSCNCISWSSLLGSGGEKLTKFLAASYLKRGNAPDGPAWQRFLADFEALATGTVDGEAVAREGRKVWKLLLLLSKSDEEVKANEYGLAHFNAPECCPDCLANASTRPYTDLRAGAAWRPSQAMDFESWHLRMRAPLHPLVLLQVLLLPGHHACPGLQRVRGRHLRWRPRAGAGEGRPGENRC